MTTLKQIRRIANSRDGDQAGFFYDGPRHVFMPDYGDLRRYADRVNSELQRIVGTMRYPHMLHMALDLNHDDDGSIVVIPRQEGYEYVVARIRHPETTESERSDLRKVVSVYRLAEDQRQLEIALDKGDYRRVNRILGGKGVRA